MFCGSKTLKAENSKLHKSVKELNDYKFNADAKLELMNEEYEKLSIEYAKTSKTIHDLEQQNIELQAANQEIQTIKDAKILDLEQKIIIECKELQAEVASYEEKFENVCKQHEDSLQELNNEFEQERDCLLQRISCLEKELKKYKSKHLTYLARPKI